ncbi:MAG: DUF1232 domain-containing protein [Gaiellaceae bacterium]
MLFIAVLLGLGGRFRDNARELVRFVPDCLVLLKRLLRDTRVPRRAKVALVLMIGYLAVPFDVVPDFIPVVGQLDDLFLVLVVIGYVVRLGGDNVVRELWPGTERGLQLVLVVAT